MVKQKQTRETNLSLRITMAFYDSAEAYRRENDALRSILRKQGLSDPAISARIRRLLKKSETDETAARLLKRVCEENLALLREHDLEKWLRDEQIKGKPQ